jgi:hypothetical protein
MAIDFMIMPLSRYIAGDFITPTMRFAWQCGVPYTIVGPDGTKQFPADTAFGGPESGERRRRVLEMLAEDLRRLPAPIPAQLWDEASDAEPCFHRVDPASYGALLEQSQQPSRGLVNLFRRRPPSHLGAMLFLPCRIDAPFRMTSPMDVDTGSAPQALDELAGRTWPPQCASAVETLGEALRDAVRLRLPLVVDV